jgi:hypothetical protein
MLFGTVLGHRLHRLQSSSLPERRRRVTICQRPIGRSIQAMHGSCRHRRRPQVSQQQGQPAFDEEQEELIRSQNEQDYRSQILLHNREQYGHAVESASELQMDETQAAQIKRMREIALTLPDRKQRDQWEKQADQIEKRIHTDLDRKNKQRHREYADRLKADIRRQDFPQKPQAVREAEAGLMESAYDSIYADTIKPDINSTDPDTKLNGEWHRRTSPYSTVGFPRPGEDPAVTEQRNRTLISGLAWTVGTMNRKLS